MTQSAVIQGGQVSLRALPPLVVVEVLFGVQQRVRGGAQIPDGTLRALCDTLRHEQAPTINSCPAECVSGKATRVLLAVVARDVRRALTDPGRERADHRQPAQVGIDQDDLGDLDLIGQPGEPVDQLGRVRRAAADDSYFHQNAFSSASAVAT